MADQRKRGIVFDMDNTLLHSKINYKAMKSDVYHYLAEHRLITPETRESEHTTSTLIETARLTGAFGADHENAVWRIVGNHEMEGMADARLEPNVEYVLERLAGRYILTVLTNNAMDAAVSALAGNGISRLFDHIVGREHVPSLKPSPAGILLIMDKYPSLGRNDWIYTGDGWIDGKAAADAGIRFISYRGDIAKMHEKGVYPLHQILDMSELLELLL